MLLSVYGAPVVILAQKASFGTRPVTAGHEHEPAGTLAL